MPFTRAAVITRADVERELLRELVAEELGLRDGQSQVVPADWSSWLRAFFPIYTRHPFAPHHADLWDWADMVERGVRPRPFVEILARGGAKSTTAELMTVYWGARRARRYVWYVSETQEQADDHLISIASMLESETIAAAYPGLSEKSLGKFGDQRGWRRNRLWTADGLIVDALGLDVASRGKKLEEQRPDAMIFDDLDRQSDGPEIVAKKIRTMTRSILPAGTDDLAVLAIQNLIHDQGIFARLAGLADEPADFLADRIVSGPHPALLDPAYEQRDGRTYVIAGTPTWAGQDLDACQRMIDTYGISAFKIECQHEVDVFEGGLFSDVAFRHCTPAQVPDLVRTVVWVDPAVTETDKSDSHGIQADGISTDKTVYRLRSWEGITSPRDSLRRALLIALEVGARRVGVETDQGGETWRSVYREAWQSLKDDELVAADAVCPSFASEKAGSGHGPKVERAQRMLADYERGKVVHVLGDHAILEKSLRRFPIREPHDLCFAAGTLIETEHGSTPIERITAGTRVWTRQGLRPVLRAGMTNSEADRVRVTFTDGCALIGTPDHPLWTENRGWASLCTLTPHDILGVWTERPSSIAASPTLGIPTRSSARTVSTSRRSTIDGRDISTDTSTRTTTGRFRPADDGKSTTTITTRSTMIRRTLSSWMSRLIVSITELRCQRMLCSGISPASVHRRPIGTLPMQGERGIAITQSAVGTTRSRLSARVSVAERPSDLGIRGVINDGVVSGARWRPSWMRVLPDDRSKSARSVVDDSFRERSPRPAARVHARTVTDIEPGPVYNLTVEGIPEYYANGILAHNCDASFWSWYDLKGKYLAGAVGNTVSEGWGSVLPEKPPNPDGIEHYGQTPQRVDRQGRLAPVTPDGHGWGIENGWGRR